MRLQNFLVVLQDLDRKSITVHQYKSVRTQRGTRQRQRTIIQPGDQRLYKWQTLCYILLFYIPIHQISAPPSWYFHQSNLENAKNARCGKRWVGILNTRVSRWRRFCNIVVSDEKSIVPNIRLCTTALITPNTGNLWFTKKLLTPYSTNIIDTRVFKHRKFSQSLRSQRPCFWLSKQDQSCSCCILQLFD